MPDLSIVGAAIAVTFVVIALSAVTLYLSFKIKETFREDKGTKIQIAKTSFIIGILFLAGGLFYFFAQALSPTISPVNAETNNTNNTNIPLLISSSKLNDTPFLEGGVLAQLKSPVIVNTPTVNITPVSTTQPVVVERYYIVSDGSRPSSSSDSSPEVPVIVALPALSRNASGNNNATLNITTPTDNISISRNVTTTPTLNSTVTSTPEKTVNVTGAPTRTLVVNNNTGPHGGTEV